MRVLEGKELEDALKQMQEWEAKKAKAIEDAFQRGIATGDDITNLLWTYTDSNLRWELFADLAEKDKLSDEAFNKGLATAWTEGRGTGDFRAIQYFMRCKKESPIIIDCPIRLLCIEVVVWMSMKMKMEIVVSVFLGLPVEM